ncbi:MAG: MerR family transcriptional regulator [Betaproteobacteria bacterium]|nr:MerR family transcriptional regulator [Betaproteobacteria bacterium]
MTEALPTSADEPAMSGISAVERDTGISKDKLRIWERRYGFPTPLRDDNGERLYPQAQVQRLRMIKRLMDAGHRPGRIVVASEQVLAGLLAAPAPSAAAGLATPQVEECMALLRDHDVEGLQRQLSQAVLRMGLGPCVLGLIAPLTTHVGEAWIHGELAIFEEHIFTEALQQVLRQALQAVPRQALAERPKVLLSTLPGEPHGLGLLMVEAMLMQEGCQCLSLGVQTPLDELPRAAAAHGADMVALSFSGLLSPGLVRRNLRELRALLPAQTELWAGGSSPALQGRSGIEGVRCLTGLATLASAVADWRASQASSVAQSGIAITAK